MNTILESRSFSGARRLQRFLRFVVEKTLLGQSAAIKELVIGVEVFDRPAADFNPALDPIVRVQARRVREKLEEYYEGDGFGDAIVVELPRGHYVPTFRFRDRPKKPSIAAGPVMTAAIAVLPFVSMSSDPENEYFSDGLTEELIHVLSGIPSLVVVARMSTFLLKGGGHTLAEIGRLLGVGRVIEGSVRRSGEQLRIVAQLVDIATGGHLWSGRYDRGAYDILAVQDEVAGAIRDALTPQLTRGMTPVAPRRSTESVEAYNHYLKGRYQWNKRSQYGFWTGIDEFRQSIRIDPSFARAWSGLADCYLMLGMSGAEAPTIVMPLAREAAMEAIRIDVDLAEAHASLIRASSGSTEIFELTAPDGSVTAGNFAPQELPDGWSTLTPRQAGITTAPGGFRVYAGHLDGYRLAVGKSLQGAKDIGAIVLYALGWAIGGVAAVTLLSGILAATSGQRRLDAIANTMEQVAHGNLAARIPRSGRNDDIDTLIASVNAALDRLAALVEGMRQVSVDIAHELKTPLSRLSISVASALADEDAGRNARPMLEDAENEIEQISSIFDAMLRIAQIEAGARKARFRTLELSPILERIADAYEPVASEKQQDFRLTVGSPDGVLGDQDLITQAIANLVENSIHHCPTGATISLESKVQAGSVQVVVSDNGTGIPDQEKSRVFDRLYRLEKSRTTPGHGLGLSLVKATADLHGASVSLADNQPGLVVTINFPIAQCHDRTQ